MPFADSESPLRKIPNSVYAGAIASFFTQPLEVLKTNLISYPSFYIKDMHQRIIINGWRTYMKGSTLAVLRQGYGFTVYTTMLNEINRTLESFSSINKYYRFSVAAFLSKATAMSFEAPLTLLKTRVEMLNSVSIKSELLEIFKKPKDNICKGLNATLVRESIYSLLHYTTYRFLKDEIFSAGLGINSNFIPAFLAGTVAISFSQPFEVIRSRVSTGFGISITECSSQIWHNQGWRGFYMGFIPRLLRKPINSGICWTVLENLN